MNPAARRDVQAGMPPSDAIPDDVFRRVFARILRRRGSAFAALAAHDLRPSLTDTCCRPDGTCDGSCERSNGWIAK